jgi:adenylyltransferase/sulfurtransferase
MRKFNVGFRDTPPIEKTFDRRELEITVDELHRRMKNGDDLFLLDVRNPDEYAFANLGGHLLPLQELPKRFGELDRKREIVVHCHTGRRSAAAVEFLYENGFQHVKNLAGGIDEWSARVDPKIPRY